ncbi:MAG: hypothetical protein P0107_02510 [Nitrosomonas sp.]|nr:hypothetical protein [Nitrosomonas sp.]
MPNTSTVPLSQQGDRNVGRCDTLDLLAYFDHTRIIGDESGNGSA